MDRPPLDHEPFIAKPLIILITMKKIIPCAAALAMLALTSHAQPYSVNWFKIAGGGGTSAGSQYSISGTIGQHDAGGPLNGASFSVSGGFWTITALQTAGAPLLKIVRTSTNAVMISWPSPSTGFSLQQNTSLETANWTTPTETITDDGTNKFIIVSPPVGNRFFRLISP